MPASPALQPVLSAAAMREADRYTIETYGLPGFTLMETAGRAAADQIEAHFGSMRGKTVTCLCGKGNNGGDGFVVARVLAARGAQVRVFSLGAPDAMTEDAAHHFRLLEQFAADEAEASLRITAAAPPDQRAEQPPDLLVDALLGTGLAKELREPIRGLVDWLNEQPQPKVALDVPTGLHSDTGEILGAAVRAALTVTMGALKAGLLLGEGPACAGRTEVAEIGIPRFALERAAAAHGGHAWRATDATVRAWLPRRSHDAHKYSVGLALTVAGAPGTTGAPVMAARAAARVGAGAVVCACPAPVHDVLAARLTEVMTLALPTAPDGGLQPNEALEALAPRLQQARALLVGPGLGRHPDTQQFVRTLLQQTELPAVVDADGLNALAEAPGFVAQHAAGRWVLTPHAGEFKRLAGEDVDLTDRVDVARTYARRWNCVLVLKGMPSVVGTPDGDVYVNGTGGPALATAGTGDVLAGFCAGLLAQGLPPAEAAVTALHLGGAAADHYARTRYGPTLLATDLIEDLPLVLQARFT